MKLVPRAAASRLVDEALACYVHQVVDPELLELLAAGDLLEVEARLDVIACEVLATFRERLDQLRVAGSA